MAFRIDDDENRIQDLKDKIDQLEIQTFSPEVVARNESTRNTGIETGDSAALNPYPQWIPIRDFGTLGDLTLVVDLNRVDSHVAKMTLDGDTIFAFSFGPGTNKMMWFILDVTIDVVGGHAITFGNNIIPVSTSIDNTANARTVIRFTTTDGGVTYYAEDLTTGGTGGVSFPIDFPITFLGTIGFTTQIIDFSLSTRHGWKAEFNGDVELAFDNPPTSEIAYAVFKFKQDVTGGHTLTLPPGTINKDIVEAGFLLGSEEETGIVIEFFNDTFYAFLETGNIVSGGGGGTGDVVGPASATDNAIVRFDGTTGKLIQNSGIIINDSDEIFGVAGIDMSGATATIQFLANINFLETNQFINSLATGLDYKVDALQDHTFRSINGDFLALTEVNATDRRLDIKQNRIVNTGKLMFSPTFDVDTAITAEIYETLTTNDLRYVSNNAHVFVQDGVASKLLTIGTFAAGGGFLNDIGFIALLPTTPIIVSADGEIQLDSVSGDVIVRSGGANRNLSNIGVAAGGADVFLSNLSSPTDINQSLLPQSGLSLGGTADIWSAVHVNNVRLGTAGVVSSSSNHIFGTSTGIDFNVPTASNFDFLVNGSNVGSISSSGTLNFENAIHDLISIGDLVTFTGFNGDIYREGVDVKIVSGGIERNISDLTGAGANVFLSNLSSPTAINQDLIPSGSLELGSLSDRWNTAFLQFLDVTNTAIFGGDVLLGNSSGDTIFMNGGVDTDIVFEAGGNTIDFFDTTNNAISGGADNVPTKAFVYIKIRANAVDLVIPAFLES